MINATASENGNFQFGNSQLLMDYREALIKAYKLGEDIKKVYGIVPPKVYSDDRWEAPQGIHTNFIVIGLTTN
jgi:hypothetical protein